jgi:hypothetical protein
MRPLRGRRGRLYFDVKTSVANYVARAAVTFV